jgi:Dehydrogenases with different specificities (related to short-chain alcohol dehydrogenases)
MTDKKPVALVTGASRGIGRAIALRLARDGYHVIINFRSNVLEAQATLKQICDKGGSGELCQFDVADRKATGAALADLLTKHTLKALVLCAGVHQDELLIFMNEDQWDNVLSVNLNSFYAVVKPVVKHMVLNRSGRIIVISSTSGETGLPGQVNYSAAKAGLIGAVKALALECARRGVLVNAVTPGYIDTGMTDGLNLQEIKAKIPLNRLGTSAEVASAVSFLASPDSSYITGQVIRVNGGIYL